MTILDTPTFDFPYFSLSVSYPDNATRVQMGKGYVFTARPDGPPQRIFKLRFNGMVWETTGNGTLDLVTRPDTNLGRLENFYAAVETWKAFWFTRPGVGAILVRFARPLDIPHPEDGGGGVVKSLEMDFIEQPLPWPTPPTPDGYYTFDSDEITFDSSVHSMDMQP